MSPKFPTSRYLKKEKPTLSANLSCGLSLWKKQRPPCIGATMKRSAIIRSVIMILYCIVSLFTVSCNNSGYSLIQTNIKQFH